MRASQIHGSKCAISLSSAGGIISGMEVRTPVNNLTGDGVRNFTHHSSPIACRIRNTCLFEAPAPQDAGVAAAARQSFRRRIVAAVREGEIHTRVDAGSNDLCLAHMQKRCMDPVLCGPFDSALVARLARSSNACKNLGLQSGLPE